MDLTSGDMSKDFESILEELSLGAVHPIIEPSIHYLQNPCLQFDHIDFSLPIQISHVHTALHRSEAQSSNVFIWRGDSTSDINFQNPSFMSTVCPALFNTSVLSKFRSSIDVSHFEISFIGMSIVEASSSIKILDHFQSPSFNAYAIIQLPSVYNGGDFSYTPKIVDDGSGETLPQPSNRSTSSIVSTPSIAVHRLDNATVPLSKWSYHIYGHTSDFVLVQYPLSTGCIARLHFGITSKVPTTVLSFTASDPKKKLRDILLCIGSRGLSSLHRFDSPQKYRNNIPVVGILVAKPNVRVPSTHSYIQPSSQIKQNSKCFLDTLIAVNQSLPPHQRCCIKCAETRILAEPLVGFTPNFSNVDENWYDVTPAESSLPSYYGNSTNSNSLGMQVIANSVTSCKFSLTDCWEDIHGNIVKAKYHPTASFQIKDEWHNSSICSPFEWGLNFSNVCASIQRVLNAKSSVNAKSLTTNAGSSSSAIKSSSESLIGVKRNLEDVEHDDDDEVEFLGFSTPILPHSRANCPIHLFSNIVANAKNNVQRCDKCFCYICDIPATECLLWITHCQASTSGPMAGHWKRAKIFTHIQRSKGMSFADIAASSDASSSQPNVFLYNEDIKTVNDLDLFHQSLKSRMPMYLPLITIWPADSEIAIVGISSATKSLEESPSEEYCILILNTWIRLRELNIKIPFEASCFVNMANSLALLPKTFLMGPILFFQHLYSFRLVGCANVAARVLNHYSFDESLVDLWLQSVVECANESQPHEILNHLLSEFAKAIQLVDKIFIPIATITRIEYNARRFCDKVLIAILGIYEELPSGPMSINLSVCGSSIITGLMLCSDDSIVERFIKLPAATAIDNIDFSTKLLISLSNLKLPALGTCAESCILDVQFSIEEKTAFVDDVNHLPAVKRSRAFEILNQKNDDTPVNLENVDNSTLLHLRKFLEQDTVTSIRKKYQWLFRASIVSISEKLSSLTNNPTGNVTIIEALEHISLDPVRIIRNIFLFFDCNTEPVEKSMFDMIESSMVKLHYNTLGCILLKIIVKENLRHISTAALPYLTRITAHFAKDFMCSAKPLLNLLSLESINKFDSSGTYNSTLTTLFLAYLGFTNKSILRNLVRNRPIHTLDSESIDLDNIFFMSEEVLMTANILHSEASPTLITKPTTLDSNLSEQQSTDGTFHPSKYLEQSQNQTLTGQLINDKDERLFAFDSCRSVRSESSEVEPPSSTLFSESNSCSQINASRHPKLTTEALNQRQETFQAFLKLIPQTAETGWSQLMDQAANLCQRSQSYSHPSIERSSDDPSTEACYYILYIQELYTRVKNEIAIAPKPDLTKPAFSEQKAADLTAAGIASQIVDFLKAPGFGVSKFMFSQSDFTSVYIARLHASRLNEKFASMQISSMASAAASGTGKNSKVLVTRTLNCQESRVISELNTKRDRLGDILVNLVNLINHYVNPEERATHVPIAIINLARCYS